MLGQLGEGAKLLAGGQSLIPLLKLRFANPEHLVDLNFIPGTSFIKEEAGALRFGAMTRHAEIEYSALAKKIPVLHDCAAGIADVQVRNRGTIGGSLAEADPSGDWANALITLDTTVHCLGPNGARTIPLNDFINDAYTTALAHDELVTEVEVKIPPKGSGGRLSCFQTHRSGVSQRQRRRATRHGGRRLPGCRDCSGLRRSDGDSRDGGRESAARQILRRQNDRRRRRSCARRGRSSTRHARIG